MTVTKVCTVCGRALALSEFYQDRRRKDGRYSTCKKCTLAKRKEGGKGNRTVQRWRVKNREHTRAYARRYYQEHREACNEAQRRYRAKKRAEAKGAILQR